MKRLFFLIPAILLVVFLTNAFVLKQNGVMLKSTDGGLTWQDISGGLPETESRLNFFAGESDLYLQAKNGLYHSSGNLSVPVWEKESVPEQQGASFRPLTSVVFNRSGVMAWNQQGQIYQKMSGAETWSPAFANFSKPAMRTALKTADGTILLGYNDGLYKSADKGSNWKQVEKGLVLNMVEADGVLLATGTKGVMRSIDGGEHWHWVISEGGLGIAVGPVKGGFAAITYNTKTDSRRIRISSDRGRTWQAVDQGLRPSPSVSSIAQVGKYLISGHPDGIFRSSDGGKTWQNVHPPVDKNEQSAFKFLMPWRSPSDEREPQKVFKIFGSGNTLYALAVSAGC